MDLVAELRHSGEVIAAASATAGVAGVVYQIAWIKKEDDPKLKEALAKWFKWVKKWNYRYFAAQEAAKFISLLDGVAGDSLWSRKRWKFAASVVVGALLVALVWTVLVHSLSLKTRYSVPEHFYQIFIQITQQVLLIPVLALSTSLTRAIAYVVVKTPAIESPRLGALLSPAAFLVTLFLHVVLFLYWSGFVQAFSMIGAYAFEAACSQLGLLGAGWVKFDFLVVGKMLENALEGSGGVPNPFINHPTSSLSFDIYLTHVRLVDWIANGVRILFALFFLGSYVVPIAVQTPLINGWERAASSEKLLLGLLLGAAAGVIAFIVEAVRCLSLAAGYIWRLL